MPFFRFVSDFAIFPDLLPKSKLNSFFKGISEFVNNFTTENEIFLNGCIELNLFVDILALCALEVNFPQPEPTPLEKVKYKF